MREVQRMMNAEVRILTTSAESTASASVTSALASSTAVVPTAMASAKGTPAAHTTGSATAE